MRYAGICVIAALMFSCLVSAATETDSKKLTDEEIIRTLRTYVEESQGRNWFHRGTMLERHGVDLKSFADALLADVSYLDYWQDALFFKQFHFRAEPAQLIREMLSFLQRRESFYAKPIREAKISTLLIIDATLYDPNGFENEEVKRIMLDEVAPLILNENLTDYPAWMKRLDVPPDQSLKFENRRDMTPEKQEEAYKQPELVRQAQSAAEHSLGIIVKLYALTHSPEFKEAIDAAKTSKSAIVRRRAEDFEKYGVIWPASGPHILPWKKWREKVPPKQNH
ncbi:MAG: hypothetical protein ABIH23_16410 [bacterium]